MGKYKLQIGLFERAPWAKWFNLSFFQDRFQNDPGWTFLIQLGRFAFNLERHSDYSLGHTYPWELKTPSRIKEWVYKGLETKGTPWEKYAPRDHFLG